MSKQQIRIDVVGHAGVGKSTIAQLIAEVLTGLDIDVKLVEPDHSPRDVTQQTENLTALKDKVQVTVGQIQAYRTAPVV